MMRIITRILEASVDEVEHLMHKKNFFGDVLSLIRVSRATFGIFI